MLRLTRGSDGWPGSAQRYRRGRYVDQHSTFYMQHVCVCECVCVVRAADTHMAWSKDRWITTIMHSTGYIVVYQRTHTHNIIFIRLHVYLYNGKSTICICIGICRCRVRITGIVRGIRAYICCCRCFFFCVPSPSSTFFFLSLSLPLSRCRCSFQFQKYVCINLRT